MTAPDISPSVSHDEATKASLIRDHEFMWAYVCELRSALTARDELLREWASNYEKVPDVHAAVLAAVKINLWERTRAILAKGETK